MKNRWKHIFILVPVMALCLSPAACGNSDDVAEDGWHMTGMTVGSGATVYDGESVDVLVTVCESSTASYRSLSGQVLFDSISSSMNIPDVEQSSNAIFSDDTDGDRESNVLMSSIHGNGGTTELVWIWGPVERYAFRENLSTVALSGDDLGKCVGLWECQRKNLWLRTRDGATWEFVNNQDKMIEYGTLWVDENGITLHFDGNDDTLQLDHTVSGGLADSVNNGMLLPVEGIQSQEPYSVKNGFETSAVVEMGTFLPGDGVCSYSGLGDSYNTANCYWGITKNGDYTHDGIRELHFDATCYIPEDFIPNFDQQYTTITSSRLYDFYADTWLTTSTAYDDSQCGNDYHLHTVSWQGNSYLVEFAYSAGWQYNVGDWAQALIKSYSVYLPEGYNGLVSAVKAQPGSHEDTAKRMQLDSISPEAAIMDIDTVDPYNSPYFSLCY